MDEVKAVRDSTVFQIFQQGIVVQLNTRHGLMNSFIIHLAFGDEGKELAQAVQRESTRGEPSTTSLYPWLKTALLQLEFLDKSW